MKDGPETVGRGPRASRRISLGLLTLAASAALTASLGLWPRRVALPAGARPLADSALDAGREAARQATEALRKAQGLPADEEMQQQGPAPKLSRPVEPGRRRSQRRRGVDIRPEVPTQHLDTPVIQTPPEEGPPLSDEAWVGIGGFILIALFFAAWAWIRSDRSKTMT